MEGTIRLALFLCIMDRKQDPARGRSHRSRVEPDEKAESEHLWNVCLSVNSKRKDARYLESPKVTDS